MGALEESIDRPPMDAGEEVLVAPLPPRWKGVKGDVPQEEEVEAVKAGVVCREEGASTAAAGCCCRGRGGASFASCTGGAADAGTCAAEGKGERAMGVVGREGADTKEATLFSSSSPGGILRLPREGVKGAARVSLWSRKSAVGDAGVVALGVPAAVSSEGAEADTVKVSFPEKEGTLKSCAPAAPPLPMLCREDRFALELLALEVSPSRSRRL